MKRVYRILSHMKKTEPIAKMNHAMNPESPKECEDCKVTKPVTEFIKYPKGINYDVKCKECRKVFSKQRREQKKLNPPAPIQVEPPIKRGRPKKIKVEEVQEVQEEVKEEVKETHRTCTMCNETKQLTAEFYHRKKENWFRACKLCRNTKRNELYRTSEAYRRQKLEYQKNYSPSYYKNNKEKLDEYRKLYRARKRELE